MHILIVTATDAEIAPLVEKLGDGSKSGPRMKTYKRAQQDIDVLTTGVGMVATAAWCSRVLIQNRYDAAEGRLNMEFKLIGHGCEETRSGFQRVHTYREFCRLFSTAGFTSDRSLRTSSSCSGCVPRDQTVSAITSRGSCRPPDSISLVFAMIAAMAGVGAAIAATVPKPEL